MKKRLLLILNPCSGKKKGLQKLADILSMFYEADYQIQLHLTEKRLDATEFVKIYGPNCDLLVCIGGDGTFNEVVEGMMEAGLSVPIGYIPMGSTNDFASSLKLPKFWKKAVKTILQGEPHCLDLCKFNERYFSYVASCGAFAKTSYSTPQQMKNALGHLAYLMEGIKDIPSIRPLHLRIRVNEQQIEGDYIFAACSNSTSVGGILKLDPHIVDMNDGKMELMLIPAPQNAVQFGKMLNCLQSKKYVSPYVTFLSASQVHIETDASFDWSLDGEQYIGVTDINIQTIPSAISILM